MDYASANGCADAAFEDLVLAAPTEDIKGPHEDVDAAASQLSCLSVSVNAFASASALELPTEFAASNHNGFAPSWICAICLEKIKMEETSQIKGCEHAYCVNCILRWASYKEDSWCPQCKLPFSSLYVCKTLDGRLSDYMLEESVCLLLRASWFKPLPLVQESEEVDDYQDEDDFDGEYYYTSTVRLGNRRWGDSGYVRGGRKEARPIGVRQVTAGEASASGSGKGKETVKETAGRRAKRAKKRELEELKLKNQQQQQHKFAGRSSK